MAEVNPTRMVLLAKRRQRALALDGVALLKNKREALLAEFLSILKPLLSQMETLDERVKRSLGELALALGIDGPEALGSAVLAAGRELKVGVKEKKVWGVRVPELDAPGGITRRLPERGYSPFSVTSRIDDTALSFERLLGAILEMVPTEVKLRRLGAEIRKTTRRVNALEQKVIPELEAQIAYIKQVLEDRAREDTFRLKMLKAKKEKKGGRF